MLLDVLIALAILGIAALSTVRFLAGASHAVIHASATESELREASAFLDKVVLWTADDLDRRLGARDQGPWRLHVSRPERQLYVLSLRDGMSGRELLRTATFKGSDAP